MEGIINIAGVDYQLVSLGCENCTDGGEIMEVLTEAVGKEIRKPGTCDCEINAQRIADYDSAEDAVNPTEESEEESEESEE